MFDGTKSFIYMDCEKNVHILYQIHDDKDEIICNKLDKLTFKTISEEFIKWYEKTEKGKNNICE